ncbi:stage III sporulation protein AE [Caldanaerobius fijiensis DSM 17918]|uniref:Stage III sporulation protein AE n=1 Tax=Caldanaerobius fijiensis DSM 17918 TaxID=1121256 RepID=A0A1M4U6H0_9THEO|nr:stage III sporulation protein AE [Caldanaerobius fijiensis]SHE52352.1 stage III sporulation protein AE [Caldanaerobius fijiensis DSM 17918]
MNVRKIEVIKMISLSALIIFNIITFAFASNLPQDIINQQEKNLNVENVQQILDEISSQNSNFPKLNIVNIIRDIINGKNILNMNQLIPDIFKVVFGEISLNIRLLIQIIALSVICALLINLQQSFNDETISQIAFIVTYMVIVILLLNSFKASMDVGKRTIDQMVNFMQALMPTLFAALVSSGSAVSAATFNPIIAFSVEGISAIMRDYIIPVIYWISVLSLINNLNTRLQIDKYIDFIRSIITTIIVLLPLMFLGVLTVEGITSPFVDNAAIKTAKFATGKFIPMVGSVMSDTFDAILRYTVILKNSIGVIGMLAVVFITVYPLIKMFALLIILKISAAFIQPISDERVVKGIEGVANSLTLLMSCVVVVAVMFFISLAILLATTSFLRV